MRLLLACVFLVGCLRAELLQCADKLCPWSQVCVVDRCVDPALVCATTGAECDALGVPGRCTDGVCEPASCGNGYVDSALREDCDDSIPDAQCVDAGFDLGRPGCTECQTDLLAGCVSFGWRLAVNAPAERLWTDGETYAYWRFEPSSLEVHGPGVAISRPFASVYDIRGGGGRVVVNGAAGLADQPDMLDIVNGQVAPLSPPAGISLETIKAFDVTPDGTLYVLAKCDLYSQALGGEWQQGPTVPSSGCWMLEISGGRTFAVDAANGVWTLRNGAFARRFIVAGIRQLAYGSVAGVEALWLATSTGLARATDADAMPLSVFDDAPISTLALVDELVYGSVEDSLGTTLVRWDGRHLGRLQTPSNRAITSDGEHVVAYGGPIYEYSGIDFSRRLDVSPIALQEQPVGVLDPPDAKRILAVFSYGLYTASDDGLGWTLFQQSDMLPLAIRAVGGVTGFTAYSAFLPQTELDRRPTLGIQQAEGSTTFVPVPSDPFIRGLWVASDRSVYAAGDDEAGRGFLGIRSPSETWSVFEPPGACSIRAVHAMATTNVIAAGTCDGAAVLWRHDGAQWTELQRFPSIATFSAVRVLGPTTLVAVGPNGLARLDGTTWSTDVTVTGNAISGTDGDLWVSGSFTNVQRFDGTSWSQMTTRALQPIQVIVDGRRVLLPGAAAGFAELLR